MFRWVIRNCFLDSWVEIISGGIWSCIKLRRELRQLPSFNLILWKSPRNSGKRQFFSVTTYPRNLFWPEQCKTTPPVSWPPGSVHVPITGSALHRLQVKITGSEGRSNREVNILKKITKSFINRSKGVTLRRYT